MRRTNGARQRAAGAATAHDDPSASDYFASLPHGWDSFPTCTASASFLRDLLPRGVLHGDALLDALPMPVRAMLARDASEEQWLPEAVHVGTMLAVRDARFGRGPRANASFLQWTEQLNRSLFDKLGALLATRRPRDLVPRIPGVWGLFHRGTPLTITTVTDVAEAAKGEAETACFELTHPAPLFAPLSLESHRRALAVLLAKAGAVQPRIAVSTEVSGENARTRLLASWQ